MTEYYVKSFIFKGFKLIKSSTDLLISIFSTSVFYGFFIRFNSRDLIFGTVIGCRYTVSAAKIKNSFAINLAYLFSRKQLLKLFPN